MWQDLFILRGLFQVCVYAVGYGRLRVRLLDGKFLDGTWTLPEAQPPRLQFSDVTLYVY